MWKTLAQRYAWLFGDYAFKIFPFYASVNLFRFVSVMVCAIMPV